MGEKFSDYIGNLERGISKQMISFPVQDTDDTKCNLMHFITKANSYIMVNIIENDEKSDGNAFDVNVDNTMHLFDDVLKELGGGVIVFADGSVFYDEYENVILADNGECEIDEYFPFEYRGVTRIFIPSH